MYQNRLGFVEDYVKNLWCVFFGSQCSMALYILFGRVQINSGEFFEF